MAAGDPTGADLTVGTTDGATLPSTPSNEEREITFGSPVELTSGVKYAIVIRALSATGSNPASWWRNTTNPYAGGIGEFSNNSGVTWTAQASDDFWFATKASGVEKDTQKTHNSTIVSVWDNVWTAQSFTASSTYTISSVVLLLSRPFASPGTVTVSIRATESGTPAKATNPSPANAFDAMSVNWANFSWDAAAGADTYDVYAGTQTGESGNMVRILWDGADPMMSQAYMLTAMKLVYPYTGTGVYRYTYYWQVNTKNPVGTTEGDIWSFDTIIYVPPGVTYSYPATGQYYRLLIDDEGNYGDHPVDGGVEDTDYVFLAATYEPNTVRTNRKLVAAANDKIWFEDII